jgi:hypothetical protein
MLSVEADGIHLYPLRRKADVHHFFLRESLRWFGRPVKYKPGRNDMWLHFEHEGQWLILRLQLSHGYMVQLVRQMKLIATPDQVTAYRRRRPYIHHGLSAAQQASQDLHGAWTLHAPLGLYLMPSHLVLLEAGRVQRALPLEQLQQIEVMRRLDAPEAGGIVRFKAGNNTMAFALPDYLSFGEALGEAAKRSLEAPPVFYGKKKDEDEEDWDE